MKITKRQLKQLVREVVEESKLIQEDVNWDNVVDSDAGVKKSLTILADKVREDIMKIVNDIATGELGEDVELDDVQDAHAEIFAVIVDRLKDEIM